MFAVLVAAACLGVLGLAAYLKPSPTGLGTHQQLGLLKCGWMISLGKPCPTCGMTTAFAHAADGNLFKSFVVQPFGSVLALLTAGGFWAAVHVALTGSRVGDLCGTLLRPRVMWAVAGAAALAWAYKLWTVTAPASGA